MSWIDLHMHSIYSNDGDFTPEELVAKCKDAQIRIMAIADHNSCRACESAIKEAQKQGIVCIPAIELDCFYGETLLHVLGYGIDYRDPRFAQLEEELNEQERASSEPRLKIMREMGLHVDEKKAYELAHYGYVTGEVIAEVALADSRNDGHPMLEAYRAGGSRSDNPYVNFYWDWCAEGKPAYIPIRFISLQEAVYLIKTAGGMPVLAHPGNNVKENGQLLDEILRCGIEGVEVYSSYHTEEQVKYYREKAGQYGMAITCGSDFHGKTKPSIYLGHIDCRGEEKTIEEGLKKALVPQ